MRDVRTYVIRRLHTSPYTTYSLTEGGGIAFGPIDEGIDTWL